MSLRLVIVTGLSGAGKSQAMKSFEDVGFHCVDNVPPTLLFALAELADDAGVERMAVALDVRTHGRFGDPLETIAAFPETGHRADLLFLEADDATLVRRFSETRRKHPLADGDGLTSAIARERERLEPLRERSAVVIDTSKLTHGELKRRIVERFVDDPSTTRLAVNIVAFGFKHGVPIDADLVFDVRFLPNPYYEPALKPLTGNDPAVAAFLESVPETEGFLAHLVPLIDFLVPHYRREGKALVTIAIGCTGGRHRSIYIMRRLIAHLAADASLVVIGVQRDTPHAVPA
jgi:UPF0042 nucleotide-binding protein